MSIAVVAKAVAACSERSIRTTTGILDHKAKILS